MGLAELQTAWDENDVVDRYADWDQQREGAAPLYREALEAFLSGREDVSTFRGRIDSLGKSHGYWGFRGTGQMFFNQLVNAADPAELTDALKAALPAPSSDEHAEAKLSTFLTFINAVRER